MTKSSKGMLLALFMGSVYITLSLVYIFLTLNYGTGVWAGLEALAYSALAGLLYLVLATVISFIMYLKDKSEMVRGFLITNTVFLAIAIVVGLYQLIVNVGI